MALPATLAEPPLPAPFSDPPLGAATPSTIEAS
jgi:hypothetical protein